MFLSLYSLMRDITCKPLIHFALLFPFPLFFHSVLIRLSCSRILIFLFKLVLFLPSHPPKQIYVPYNTLKCSCYYLIRVGGTTKGGRLPVFSRGASCSYDWGLATGTRLGVCILTKEDTPPGERCWDTPNCKDKLKYKIYKKRRESEIPPPFYYILISMVTDNDIIRGIDL